MIAALALAVFNPVQTTTVNLYRGATVDGKAYLSVTDTTLDSTEQDKPNGGSHILIGGKGRTILITFGDLDRVLGPNAKVSKATLYLTPSSPDRPSLTAVGAVQAPWGEGPMLTTLIKDPVKEGANRWASTWRHRRAGEDAISWQQSGANGPGDTKALTGLSSKLGEREFAIEGLAPAVEAMANRWHDNNGFALFFDGPAEFFSSQAVRNRPRLEIEFTRGASGGADLAVTRIERTADGYVGHIKNLGVAASGPFSVSWSLRENSGTSLEQTKSLQPGETTTISASGHLKSLEADHRTQPVTLKLVPQGADADPSNNAVTIYEGGIPLTITLAGGAKEDLAQLLVRDLNDVYFAHSRFSFAPDGVRERVNVQNFGTGGIEVSPTTNARDFARRVVVHLGAPDLGVAATNVTIDGRVLSPRDRYPGATGGGDTRYEGFIPPALTIPYEPVMNTPYDQSLLEPSHLLAATEVAALNTGLGKSGKDREGVLWDMPPTILLKAMDLSGKPIEGAELAFFQVDSGKVADIPLLTVVTSAGGSVLVPSKPVDPATSGVHQLKPNPFGNLKADGSNGMLLIRALINGEPEYGWLKAWQLTDAFHRGNKAVGFVEVRFNAPAGPLDRGTNLAQGRTVSDISGSLPAKLVSLVDGNSETIYELGAKEGDWVEIDLGRDRPLGEVLIQARSMPAQFDILTYATGQKPNELAPYYREIDFSWSLQNRGDGKGTVAYRGSGIRARYIRIVNRSGGAGSVAEIKVTPLKAQQ